MEEDGTPSSSLVTENTSSVLDGDKTEVRDKRLCPRWGQEKDVSPSIVVHQLTVGVGALHPLPFAQDQVEQRHAKLNTDRFTRTGLLFGPSEPDQMHHLYP